MMTSAMRRRRAPVIDYYYIEKFGEWQVYEKRADGVKRLVATCDEEEDAEKITNLLGGALHGN